MRNNEIVREEEIIANTMNNYFTNITTHLKLKSTKTDSKVNLEILINTFRNHEGFQRIKLANFDFKSSLKFNSVRELDVNREILNLPSKKATKEGNIPGKIPKNSRNVIRNCLKKGVFPR